MEHKKNVDCLLKLSMTSYYGDPEITYKYFCDEYSRRFVHTGYRTITITCSPNIKSNSNLSPEDFYNKVIRMLSKWLQKKTVGNSHLILFPEYHVSGAIHFHGCYRNINPADLEKYCKRHFGRYHSEYSNDTMGWWRYITKDAEKMYILGYSYYAFSN